ncbi:MULTISPECIES: PrsW family glutamic-type intramembrane protease [unclassified Leptolyngbya]|uniref:PrsW family glutamic-type intramembrane protease n=1 Tax=unclassified Leptolyngbya TaxID=2650499 RepID=UPI001688516A|nr:MULTISPECIES: PrsW family glutamic-type intramembrane protease [unclassified Leptolyngbya]MBD1912480.1 PrsW family intramembrane metalloprotease [Leptolyngbya sp. FACHB-8]MBD2156509.1 PrsW family intramembrane metalloprotease [Leptolyngbya sp. FACHB-16]
MAGSEPTSAVLQQVYPAEGTATLYPLATQRDFLIGRDPSCQISLPFEHGGVSRFHARLTFSSDSEGWQLCDLNSTNGTYLNGHRLQGCRMLRVGDRIRLGHHGPQFVFTEANAPVPTPVQRPVSDPVTFSQLFPIFSTAGDLEHKAYLIPGIITVTVAVVLFMAVGNVGLFNGVLALYLALAAYYVVYQLCGKHKPLWLPVVTALLMAGILRSPVLNGFIQVFRVWLPGSANPSTAAQQPLWFLLQMFIGTGVMEELLKALPILLFWLIGWALRPSTPSSPRSLAAQIGVWEPLDGILLGTAAAVGFTLFESLGYYVPSMIQSGSELEQLSGMQVLIARVLGSISGHLAYSGTFGYFIGLSVLKRSHTPRILGTGLLTAALLHTLWNVSGLVSPIALAVVGSLSYAFLGAAILQARSLSPDRANNFATRFKPPSSD